VRSKPARESSEHSEPSQHSKDSGGWRTAIGRKALRACKFWCHLRFFDSAILSGRGQADSTHLTHELRCALIRIRIFAPRPKKRALATILSADNFQPRRGYRISLPSKSTNTKTRIRSQPCHKFSHRKICAMAPLRRSGSRTCNFFSKSFKTPCMVLALRLAVSCINGIMHVYSCIPKCIRAQ